MPIEVTCAKCGKSIKAADKFAGKRVACPGCKSPLEIPAADELGQFDFGSAGGAAPELADIDLKSIAGLDAAVPSPPTLNSTPPAMTPPAAAHVAAPPTMSGSFAGFTFPASSSLAPPKSAKKDKTEKKSAPPRLPVAGVSSGGSGALSAKSTWPLSLLFGLTLVPLALALLIDEDDTEERWQATEERLAREDEAALESYETGIAELEAGEDPMSLSEATDKALALLPENRIDGAHLPRDSWLHWLYALASITLFLLMLRYFFDRGDAEWPHIVLVGVCVATFGVFFLLTVQFIAAVTQGWLLVSRNIFIMIIFYVFWFIGFSYNAALDPANGFWLSFFGFTFGVGLLEEFSKALPLFFRIRAGEPPNWRGCCMWGLAGGVGFGVAEGIIYASDFYNGVATFGIYPVRFVSCVALHAAWGGAVGIAAYKYQHLLQQNGDWGDLVAAFLRIMAVPMILHGLYDTLLKKEMNLLALLVAVASFVWLVFVMWQATRVEEDAEADSMRRALTSKSRAMYGG